jgi:hypothetical protein
VPEIEVMPYRSRFSRCARRAEKQQLVACGGVVSRCRRPLSRQRSSVPPNPWPHTGRVDLECQGVSLSTEAGVGGTAREHSGLRRTTCAPAG